MIYDVHGRPNLLNNFRVLFHFLSTGWFVTKRNEQFNYYLPRNNAYLITPMRSVVPRKSRYADKKPTNNLWASSNVWIGVTDCFGPIDPDATFAVSTRKPQDDSGSKIFWYYAGKCCFCLWATFCHKSFNYCRANDIKEGLVLK